MTVGVGGDGAARRRLVESIFHEAAERAGGERAAVLESRCGGDAAVRAEVEALLRQFDSGTMSLLREIPSAVSLGGGERPGDRVGPYLLREEIGEGGFGVVFIAEQEEPVRRRVALKVLKAGMDTRAVLARFDAERQALSLMDHPNIARVLDAGSTPAGRPFFVMELVQGSPLTHWCDARRLGLRERLDLFMQVCRAVQHAHQKGIIHRDLKPSNILVAETDGRGVPKVIDFGIAKALHGPLLEQSLQTQQGQVVGTPEYMSPEQAGSGGVDIDTRTDVYSLGVVLYELATGALPFDSGSLRSRGLAAMQQIIREMEPPRPSTRLSGLARDAAEDSARRRRTDRATLVRMVRGDLEWIILKAIEKDRSRRYDSAAALAADIERHLRDEPVQAGPPGRVYRARKFVRRHRVGVAAGAAIAAALAVGVAASVAGFVRARAERDRAVAAERTALERSAEAERARDRAESEAARARAVTGFLTGMLSSVKPAQALGREVTVLSVLDLAASRVEEEFGSDPVVLSEVRMVIGSTYRLLDRYEEAEPHLFGALREREALFGPSAPLSLDARMEWAHWLIDQGRYEEALGLAEEAEGWLRSAAPPDPARLSRVLMTRARVRMAMSGYAEAEAAAREALELRRALHGGPHADIADALDTLGRALDLLNRKAEAVPVYEESLAMRRLLHAEDGPALANTINNLASVLHDLGRYDDAEGMYRRSLALAERIHGRESTPYATPLNNLAMLLQDRGDYGRAEEAFRESLAIRRRHFGPEHPSVLNAVNNLGGLLFYQGRFAEAQEFFEEALEVQRRVLGPTHTQTVVSLSNLGAALSRQGLHDQALPCILEAYEINVRARGPEHRFTLNSLVNLVNCLFALERYEEGHAVADEVFRVRLRVLGEDHPDTQIARRLTGIALMHRGMLAESEAVAHEVCRVAESRPTPIESEQRANAWFLGRLYERLGRPEEAARWGAAPAP